MMKEMNIHTCRDLSVASESGPTSFLWVSDAQLLRIRQLRLCEGVPSFTDGAVDLSQGSYI